MCKCLKLIVLLVGQICIHIVSVDGTCQARASPNLTMVVNDRELTFYNNLCTFNEAENACKQRRATLVNVVSRDIVNKISDHGEHLAPICYWTGGMRLTNGNWTWSNGTKPIQTYYWEVGAPTISESQEAAICQRHNGSSIEWNDLNKSTPNYYICEKESSLLVHGLTIIIYDKPLTYKEAKVTCQSLNASLVDVKSKTLQATLQLKINGRITNNPKKTDFSSWSGGEKNKNGTWSWSDGSEIAVESNSSTFQKWRSGYPKDYGEPTALVLNFQENPPKNITKDHWVNARQVTKHSVICQKDYNECETNLECSSKATCHNTFTSHVCLCMDGYEGDGHECNDTNECGASNNCSANARCHNTDGSYTCSCRDGYSGDGLLCADVNECDTSNKCSRNATCSNTNGSYTCICMDGYFGDGIVCRDYCYEEMLNNYTFPSTKLNNTAFSTERCQNGSPLASIRCERLVGTFKEKAGLNESTLNILQCNEKEQHIFYFQQQLMQFNVTTSSLNITFTLDLLSSLVNSAIKEGSGFSLELFDAIFALLSEIVKKVSEGQITLSVKESRLIVEILSAIARLVEVGETTERDSSVFFIKVSTRMETFAPNYLTFDNRNTTPVKLTLPDDAFRLEKNKNRSSFILYKSSILFPGNEVPSLVVSAEVGRDDSRKDYDPLSVSIQFIDSGNCDNGPCTYGRHKIPNDSQHALKTRLRCVFWDFNTTSWSDDGCFLNLTSNPPECLCNHLTNFALIVTSEYTLSDVALEIVSILGSVLSICGLFFTVVIHACNREARQRRPTKIMFNLCCNLLVVYVIFLAGVSQTSNKIGCDVAAMFLHYFLLTSWSWMVVYSYEIYMSLIKVFRQSQQKFLQRVSLFAYGFPALVVSITAGITLGYVDKQISKNIYPPEPDPLLESSYRADSACWLRHHSLYFGFLLPVGIMLLFNVIVFVSVFRELTCKKKDLNSATERSRKDNVWIALTLTSMMGITWLLAYFILITRIPLYVTITSWLFAIFNVFQGFFIFLMTTVRRKTMRKSWMDPLCNCVRRVLSNTPDEYTEQTEPTDAPTISFRK